MEAEPLDVDTLHHEPGPVVRDIEADDKQRGRRILVAVDQPHHSNHAFDWAITHFCRLGDTLHLLHVLPSRPEDMSYNSSKESPPGLFEDISAFMEKLAVEAHEVAMVNTEVEIVGGDVGKMIVEIATQISPVAVVMGTTSCGVLKR